MTGPGKHGIALVAAALLALLPALTMNGCGARPDPGLRRYEDEALESANRMGRYAFEKGKFEQAAESYGKALERAYIRADAAAILDARYNLAVCRMALGQYPAAMQLVDQAKQDLATRSTPVPPDLLLLEATVLFRNGAPGEAKAVIDTIETQAASPMVLAKTHFLRGLIADDRGDIDGLRRSLAAMGTPDNEVIEADVSELTGRLAIAEKDWPAAITALDSATQTRRKHFDYRRMAISLALSAKACENAGQKELAANRYLKAGRSAALRGDSVNARQWLEQAIRLFDLIGKPDMSSEAADRLSDLKNSGAE